MSTHVLIADDDQEILELIKFTFENEKYLVSTASDGEEALEKAIEVNPDVVILDVNMPKMSGFEVCERLRENSATCLLPIIMLTSLTKTKDRMTGIKLGADEYLTKPFEPLELIARVEGIVRRIKRAQFADPLTGLPGNNMIEHELRAKIESTQDFAILQFDINHLKAFNSVYGFERGDAVIKLFSVILRTAGCQITSESNFIGHLGGDDFIVISTPESAVDIANCTIAKFDEVITDQYDDTVKNQGFITVKGPDSNEEKHPLLSLAIGILTVRDGSFTHHAQIMEKLSALLQRARQQEKSGYVSE